MIWQRSVASPVSLSCVSRSLAQRGQKTKTSNSNDNNTTAPNNSAPSFINDDKHLAAAPRRSEKGKHHVWISIKWANVSDQIHKSRQQQIKGRSSRKTDWLIIIKHQPAWCHARLLQYRQWQKGTARVFRVGLSNPEKYPSTPCNLIDGGDQSESFSFAFISSYLLCIASQENRTFRQEKYTYFICVTWNVKVYVCFTTYAAPL